MEIIRKRANGVDNFLRIPAFLKLNALPLDRLAVQQSIDIDG